MVISVRTVKRRGRLDGNFWKRLRRCSVKIEAVATDMSPACIDAVSTHLTHGTPEIFNTDQGVQYTATVFTDRLELAGVAISMDGRGRWTDNVFVERLWRTLKWEWLYLHDYATVRAFGGGSGKVLPVLLRQANPCGLELPFTPATVYVAA